jgi:hypothetical protein
MTDVPKNMESFNRVSLKLFARLYDSFPNPFDINPIVANELGFAAVPQEATEEEAFNIGTSVVDVVKWLAEEGFLRYDTDTNQRYGYFLKVRLSLKGLTILGYVPSSLQTSEQKEALITKVKHALASGVGTVASESIKLVVAEIFKLALAPGAAIVGHMYA